MKRRRYLALLSAGFSGCGGLRSHSSATTTPAASNASAGDAAPTRTPSGTRTPVDSQQRVLESNDPYETADGQVVRLSIHRTRRGIVAAGTDDRLPVPADRQFLQVGVSTSGDSAPAPSDLCLAATVDGERPYEGCTARTEAIDGDRRGQLRAVPVPLEFDADAAGVVWQRPDAPDVTWTASERTVATLRTPPEFVVEDLVVPETATDGELFDVRMTVRNDGGRKDWFVAELGPASRSDGMTVEIPYAPGETRTPTRELRASFGDDDEMLVRLDWGLDSMAKPVRRA